MHKTKGRIFNKFIKTQAIQQEIKRHVPQALFILKWCFVHYLIS